MAGLGDPLAQLCSSRSSAASAFSSLEDHLLALDGRPLRRQVERDVDAARVLADFLELQAQRSGVLVAGQRERQLALGRLVGGDQRQAERAQRDAAVELGELDFGLGRRHRHVDREILALTASGEQRDAS